LLPGLAILGCPFDIRTYKARYLFAFDRSQALASNPEGAA
jgi:hypothetical protein